MFGEICIAYRRFRQGKKQFAGSSGMRVTAVAVGDLGGSDGRRAASGREHDDLSIDPTAGISSLAGGSHDRSNSWGEMFGRSKLPLKTLCNGCRCEPEHITVAVIFPND